LTKRKILIITGEFLPNTPSIGGVIRLVSFLKSLQGNEIKLISVKKKYYGYFGFKKYVEHVEKIYINTELPYQNNWRRYIFYLMKIFLSNLFYILGIDHNFFNHKKFSHKVIKTMKFYKPNYILITAPPFSLFRLVNVIRKIDTKVKIILDYRDGWTLRVKSYSLFLIKKIMNLYEKRIIQKSDFILCATENIFKDIETITDDKKIILLKNGYLNKKNKKKIKKYGKNNKEIKIGYFGIISDSSFGYRDIKIIHNSLTKNNNLNFTFYGNSLIKNKTILNNKKFNFKKNISYSKTLSKMINFDYLLILHTEKSTAKEVVTGKFYDYLNSNTPIIMISNGETEAGKLIKKYNLGYAVDYSRVSLSNFFSNLKITKFKRKNLKDLKKYSRFEQNKKLLKIIK
jgi:hypothetical protein